MKKYTCFAFTFCTIILIITSCRKDEVPAMDFDVTVSGTTFSLVDTVRFMFKGDADVISFYSGESGNNYAFSNRTSRNDGSFKFSFQTRVDNAAGFAALAAGNLRIMASTNFTAAYSTNTNAALAASADSAMINSATWTDITGRFSIPSSGSTGTFYNSGEVVLGDLVTDPAAPLFLAYKYVGATTGSLGTNGITIGNMALVNNFSDGTSFTYNVLPGSSNSTIWKIIRAANPANAWATSTTQLKFTSTATTAYSEDWAVSNSYFPNQVNPDKAIPVKSLADNKLNGYSYKFKKAGTYSVVFLASNNRKYGKSEKMKEFSITITP
jgi:hypothetical protein